MSVRGSMHTHTHTPQVCVVELQIVDQRERNSKQVNNINSICSQSKIVAHSPVFLSALSNLFISFFIKCKIVSYRWAKFWTNECVYTPSKWTYSDKKCRCELKPCYELMILFRQKWFKSRKHIFICVYITSIILVFSFTT